MNPNDKAARDNRSRQLNPEYVEFWRSRGINPERQAEDSEFDYVENEHSRDDI